LLYGVKKHDQNPNGRLTLWLTEIGFHYSCF
jgi:hypothetical protein